MTSTQTETIGKIIVEVKPRSWEWAVMQMRAGKEVFGHMPGMPGVYSGAVSMSTDGRVCEHKEVLAGKCELNAIPEWWLRGHWVHHEVAYGQKTAVDCANAAREFLNVDDPFAPELRFWDIAYMLARVALEPKRQFMIRTKYAARREAFNEWIKALAEDRAEGSGIIPKNAGRFYRDVLLVAYLRTGGKVIGILDCEDWPLPNLSIRVAPKELAA